MISRISLIVAVVAIAATSYWVNRELNNFEGILAQIDPYSGAQSTDILDRHGQLLLRLGSERRKWVPLAAIPDGVKAAFIAAEDGDFYHHFGLSPRGIIRAAGANLRAMRVVGGASTITQQVARMLFLGPERSLERKVKEVVFALLIERRYSKDKILEIYLNRVYLGFRAYGVGAAAQAYFSKNIGDISLGEGALLAGLAQAPSRYAPHRHLKRARLRQAYVLRRMRLDKIIDEATEVAQKEAPINLRLNTARERDSGYFINAVEHQMSTQLGLKDWAQKGMRVNTSLDRRTQMKAKAFLNRLHQDLAGSGPDLEAALIALDLESGGIRAYYGGFDYDVSQYDRASQMRRQIGGQINPFLALMAFDYGFDLTAPIDVAQKYQVIDLLTEVAPHASAALAITLGLGSFRRFLSRIGMPTKAQDMSIILGFERMSPWQLLGGWASAIGTYKTPYLISSVIGPDGATWYKAPSELRSPLISDQARYVLRHALRGGLPQNPALSTWVAQGPDLHDLWVVAYDDAMFTLVWIGRDLGARRIAPTSAKVQAIGLLALEGINRSLYLPIKMDQPSPPPHGIHFRMIGQGSSKHVKSQAFIR